MLSKLNYLVIPLVLLLMPFSAHTYWSRGAMDWESVPRVLYGPGEEESVRLKLEREPYISLYRRVMSIADRSGFDLEDHEISPEQNKSNTAKAAAFVYAMDRTVSASGRDYVAVPFASPEERLVYGARAEELLVHMITYSRFREGLAGAIKDIHSAQELTMYATAYDILRGAGYPFSADNEDAIQRNIADLSTDFHRNFVHDQFILTNGLNNNHRSKSASALGIAAIVLNGYDGYVPEDDPEGYGKPGNWIDFGVRETDFVVLDANVSREGSFNEGANYYSYSAINHMHFFRAMHRYVGEQGWEVDGFEYGDMLFREDNRRIHDWLVRVQLPDGTWPPFDDCTPAGQYVFGLVTDLPHGGLYRWAWERQPSYYFASGSVGQEVDAIVAYDDEVEAVHPDDLGWRLNQFLYDGGHAVFRSSWEQDAVYMIVMAEHGKAAGWALRRDGEEIDGLGGHDQNDPGALHLFAYGRPLLLDPGYLGWDKRDKVNKPKNHNIMLVNGEGPENQRIIIPNLEMNEEGELWPVEGEEGGWVPGRDGQAYLNDCFDADSLSYARIDTRYDVKVPATDISRHVMFVRGRYFFVFDKAKGESDEERDFTLLWHGHGGGTSGGSFTGLDDGGRWVYEDAEVSVVTRSDIGPLSFEEGEDFHDPGNRRELTHTVIKGSVRGKEAGFASVILPEPLGANGLSAVWDDANGGWCVADGASQGTEEVFGLSDEESVIVACGAASAEAEALFLGKKDGAILHYLLIGGTSLSDSDGKPLFESAKPLRVYANNDGGLPGIEGNIGGPPDGEAAAWFALPDDATVAEVSGACGASVRDGGIELTFRRGGDFSVRLGEGPTVLRPLAVAEPSTDTAYLGAEVVIDASRSCPSSDSLSISFELVERPYASAAALSDEGKGSAAIVPDMTGHYLVKLTVSDGVNGDTTVTRFFAEPGEPGEDEEEFEAETDGDLDLEPDIEEGTKVSGKGKAKKDDGCASPATPAEPISALLLLALFLLGRLPVGRRRRSGEPGFYGSQ